MTSILVCVCVSGLLKAAIRDPDPVVFLEDEIVYGVPFPMSDEAMSPDFVLPIGKAKVERAGDHITIVCAGKATHTALEAANELAGKGIECEVINLRSIRPLDFETIAQSLSKTHHLITLEQGWPQSGVGAEICARVMESPSFFELDAPVWRVTGADVPMPYARSLEALALPQRGDVVAAVAAVLGNRYTHTEREREKNDIEHAIYTLYILVKFTKDQRHTCTLTHMHTHTHRERYRT
ncbi:unnamed protein product [Danaus chrysippus]|uniref:Pyruvate dehydrogenase E1 component subunit beta n=1 Tax=Danaus chrysippus TaxID=151541 RepID=A0A8J2R2F0_9NEOP|nr:unnamed protein product [Danaus chrysippus]